MWGRFARRHPRVPTTIECLTLPDGDSIELHHLDGEDRAPHLVLLHGLEGSPRSHYVGGVLSQAHERGWRASLLVFRGCGATPNVARRFYHSGETQDLDFVFARLSMRWPDAAWFAVGVSLGGNVLLKWLGERGREVAPQMRAAAAISVPFDLEAGSRHIAREAMGIYDRSFLRSLRHKALAKLERYPDLFDRARLARANSVFEFDDAVTAPVHGFSSAHDYYEKSSSLQFLPRIRVPTLLLSSFDDPFIPPDVLARAETVARANAALTVEFYNFGGHVGFVAGEWPWRARYYAEWRVFRYFEDVMERDTGNGYD
jgi:predicted alpha/beta-fold hydrolase